MRTDLESRTAPAEDTVAGHGRIPPVTVAWIGIALTTVMAAAVALMSWRHRIDMRELGTVSHQWLSEQRAHDRHFSER